MRALSGWVLVTGLWMVCTPFPLLQIEACCLRGPPPSSGLMLGCNRKAPHYSQRKHTGGIRSETLGHVGRWRGIQLLQTVRSLD